MNIQPLKIQIRFADLDIMGHVNNTVYFSYFEMARVYYFKQLVGTEWNWNKNGIVIAKNEVEYIKPVLLYHEPEIYVSTENIGTKSFTFVYELKVEGEIFAIGRSVQVCYDSVQQKPIPVPADMRSGLEKLIN